VLSVWGHIYLLLQILTMSCNRLWLCLVREKKIFRCHIGCFMRCRKRFSDANKKTNYIAHLETTR
jgi:hypothetical protein